MPLACCYLAARSAKTTKTKAPDSTGFPNESEAFKWSGRQDLNLRPLGPERVEGALVGVAESGEASQPVDVSGGQEKRGRRDGKLETQSEARFVVPVSYEQRPALKVVPERLLSVGEVAAELQVSKATVYKLCERGELPHLRVMNAIRVAPADLRRFIEG